MKNLKACNIVRMALFCAAIVLGLAALAQSTCSPSSVAGKWGYSETGTVYGPNGPVPYSSLGNFTLDSDGNYSGSRTASAGGAIQKAAFTGHATVNADCTGTLTIYFYNPMTNAPLNTVSKNLVFLNNSTEARALVTSVVLPDNITTVQTVLLTDAKKMSSENQQ